jgi:hypothetical protein
MKRKNVRVHDKIQRGYIYELVAAPGRGFAQGFEPELSPAECCGWVCSVANT